LSVEDLAYLTCSSTATVKRDLAACRAVEIAVPTRGQIRDIGPGVSHKAQIVQLYLWGLQFTEIELRTRHSESAIKRYLADFRQVAALYERARREFPSAPRLADLLEVARRGSKKGGPR
jgi:hypothetical protein